MTVLPNNSHLRSGIESAIKGLLERVTRSLPTNVRKYVGISQSRSQSDIPPPVIARGSALKTGLYTNFPLFRVILTVLWALAIWWNERSIFQRTIETCEWQQWEHWPSGATPHHVVMIADPQLVDPHTYPGRPWPLSSMTVFYTDLYLERIYTLLQTRLHPDTTFLLGDLFDGGREWGTRRSSSPEKRYKRYGEWFWMHEYKRFKNIFIDHFNDGGYLPDDESVPTRRLMASLPGNHDLGFASGIQQPVKDRFQAYFGEGNRIDIIGNHSFISVDTVSLSAMDQPDPVTGSSGSADGSTSSPTMRAIWQPVQDFLIGAQAQKRRLVTEDILRLKGYPGLAYHQEFSHSLLSPEIASPDGAFDMIHNAPPISVPPSNAFPNVLLTHVPLYRPPDTDCGPLREGGRAISISAGYQYQNALTPVISENIMDKIGAAETIQVFSGDDHDYCDVTHTAYTGRVKETTVKSISWAMGVRRPGFQAVSLWNPVNIDNGQKSSSTAEGTLQQHLCLLPDQLGIFIRYAQLLGLSLFIIAIHTYAAISKAVEAEKRSETSLLPIANISSNKKIPLLDYDQTDSPVNSPSTNSSTAQGYASARNATTPRARSASTSKVGVTYSIPQGSRSNTPTKNLGNFGPVRNNVTSPFPHMTASQDEGGYDDWGMPLKRSRKSKIFGFLYHFRKNVWSIAWPVLLFYLWVIWHG